MMTRDGDEKREIHARGSCCLTPALVSANAHSWRGAALRANSDDARLTPGRPPSGRLHSGQVGAVHSTSPGRVG